MRGDRLKSVRESRGLSQQELGERVGLHKQQIYVYEKGDGNPSIDLLARIANELEVSIDYLVGLSDAPTEHFRETELTPEERALIMAIRIGWAGKALKLMSEMITDDLRVGRVHLDLVDRAINGDNTPDDPDATGDH